MSTNYEYKTIIEYIGKAFSNNGRAHDALQQLSKLAMQDDFYDEYSPLYAKVMYLTNTIEDYIWPALQAYYNIQEEKNVSTFKKIIDSEKNDSTKKS